MALATRKKFGYGLGHVLNDLCSAMWFTYLLIFFHQVLLFNNTLAGIVLLIGQIADALSTPFVGHEADRTDDLKFCILYGRRKTWHLIGTICVTVTFPFLFLGCLGCETASPWAQVLYFAPFVVLFQFGWAAAQISHLALIPALTPDSNERTELNAIRYAFSVTSNITVYVIAWLILGIIGSKSDDLVNPQDEYKFQFYQIAMIYMATRLFCNLSQAYVPLYLQDSLKLEKQSIAYIPLVMYVSGFITTSVMKPLNRKAGRQVSFIIGAVIGASGCLGVFFGDGYFYKKYLVYVVAVLLGSGGSTMLVTSLSLTADLIGDNIESSAFVYGAMSFTDKLSNGIAILIIQTLTPCLTCCIKCALYFRNVVSIVCGGAAVFGLAAVISLIPKHIIHKRKEENVENEERSLVTSADEITNQDDEQGDSSNSLVNGGIQSLLDTSDSNSTNAVIHPGQSVSDDGEVIS